MPATEPGRTENALEPEMGSALVQVWVATPERLVDLVDQLSRRRALEGGSARLQAAEVKVQKALAPQLWATLECNNKTWSGNDPDEQVGMDKSQET